MMPARAERWLPLLVVAAVCGLALSEGLATTRGLRWPFDEDLFRDIAQARTMADGAWLADPFYRGESLWYNPLGPATIAVGSKALGLPTNEASLRLGPWLGLLGPLAFTVLAVTVLGRWTAVTALLLLVFVTPGGLPALQCATYSPWPFAAQIAQAPFYFGLAVLALALARPALSRFALAGGLLGLAFLGHTGPALLLGAVAATLILLGHTASGAHLGRRVTWLAAFLAAALVVASPFLTSILGRYHLRVVNPEPGAYVWTGTGLDNLGGILAGALSRPVLLALVLLGLALWIARPSETSASRPARPLLLAWIGWGLVLLTYSLTQPALAGRGLPFPPFVPAFHFWMLLSAPLSLLAASALAWIAGRVVAAVVTTPERRAVAAAGTTVGLGLALAAAAYPAWRTRDDFVEARRLAEFHGGWSDRIAAHEWVRAHTRTDDVFLAEHDAGLRVVATAGRKLVAMDSGFSSPFVPIEPRTQAASKMLAALNPDGHAAFHPLAVEYHVGYVLYQREGPDKPFPEAPFLTRVFKDGDFAIYRAGCWPERLSER